MEPCPPKNPFGTYAAYGSSTDRRGRPTRHKAILLLLAYVITAATVLAGRAHAGF